ncbi:MAG: NAD(P)H-dependent oxidoreductase subunit E [Candidatus Woesearchaeota archaeon]
MDTISETGQDSVADGKVIERLQRIQIEYGYLPKESLVAMSKEFDIPLSKLYGIVTFYSFFKLNKGAENKIQVCDGTACHVHGAEDLTKKLTEILGIEDGEVTEDGKFSLETVRCLGMCASAPIIRINDEVYPKVDIENVKSIIDEHRK